MLKNIKRIEHLSV